MIAKEKKSHIGRRGGSKVVPALFLIVAVIGLLYIVSYAFPEVFTFWKPVFAAPVIYGASPADGEIRFSGEMLIRANFSSSGSKIASVTLLVDGMNVTGGAAIGATYISHAASLAAGTHSVSLTVSDGRSRTASRSWTFSVSGEAQGVAAQALDEINTARIAAGVQNVSLITPVSSSHRADDMLAGQYFGHYDLNGYCPGYWYTLLGGAYAAEENIGYRHDQAGFPDAATTAREIIHIMIYDDASAGWGHRDSLLDPSNHYAEVSVAYDSNRFFIVINMVRQLVDWVAPPAFSNGTFSCAGRLSLNASSIQDVRIYFSNYSLHKGYFTDSPFLNITMGQLSYSLGDPVGGVIPSPYQYFDVPTVRPKTWQTSGQDFSFSVAINDTYGPGIYTIAVLANNTSPVKSPYNPVYDDLVPVLWYAIKLP